MFKWFTKLFNSDNGLNFNEYTPPPIYRSTVLYELNNSSQTYEITLKKHHDPISNRDIYNEIIHLRWHTRLNAQTIDIVEITTVNISKIDVDVKYYKEI